MAALTARAFNRDLGSLPPGTPFRIGTTRGIVLSHDGKEGASRVRYVINDDIHDAEWSGGVRVEVLPEVPPRLKEDR